MFDKLNAILSLFSEAKPEWPPAAAARELKLPRSTAYRILARMAESGLLDHDEETGRYRLGIRLAGLGALAQRSSSLQRAAAPLLHALSVESQETVTLLVRSGSKALSIHVEASAHPVMSVAAQLAERVPMHASAAGKVLLAHLSDEARAEILSTPLEGFTMATVTDASVLMRQLEQVRVMGVAIARGEWVDDVYGVAAPVRNYAGSVVAAISLAGPRVRMSDARIDALVPLVKATAAELSAALGHGGARR